MFFYPAFFWPFKPHCCIVQNLAHKRMSKRHVSFLGQWLCNWESWLPSVFLLLPEGSELFCQRSEIKSPLPQRWNLFWILLETLVIWEHLHSAKSACCMSWNHNQLAKERKRKLSQSTSCNDILGACVETHVKNDWLCDVKEWTVKVNY